MEVAFFAAFGEDDATTFSAAFFALIVPFAFTPLLVADLAGNAGFADAFFLAVFGAAFCEAFTLAGALAFLAGTDLAFRTGEASFFFEAGRDTALLTDFLGLAFFVAFLGAATFAGAFPERLAGAFFAVALFTTAFFLPLATAPLVAGVFFLFARAPVDPFFVLVDFFPVIVFFFAMGSDS